jgi:hypothetical protein
VGGVCKGCRGCGKFSEGDTVSRRTTYTEAAAVQCLSLEGGGGHWGVGHLLASGEVCVWAGGVGRGWCVRHLLLCQLLLSTAPVPPAHA